MSISTIMPCSTYAAVNNGWEINDGNWYYYENWSRITGWRYDRGLWYYLNSDGTMKTGWLNDRGCWYYLNNDGSMAKGWKKVDGNWYYLESSGAMKTGWLNDRGTWYYLNSDGTMAYDTVIDGYILNSNGAYVEESSNTNSVNENKALDNSSYQKGETNKEKDTFIEGLNKFCSDTSSIILGSEDKNTNTIYSPVSFYMALAVLSEGADNNTKNEILNALNVEDKDKLSEECMKLYNKEIFNSKYGKCTLADSVWIDDDNEDVEFNEETLKKIENDYKAGVFKGDLQSMDTAEKISSWLLEHTGGLLGGNPENFLSNEGAVMDIFNAVYFKDKWSSVFDKADTDEGEFTLNDGNKVKTDFMSQNIYSPIYESSNGYKAGSLEFESGKNMMFILPDEGKSVYDIINNKDKLSEALNSLCGDNVESHNVYYRLPKFKFSSNINLNECSQKIGLINMYDSSTADFTRFTEKGNLWVSNIHQEATVSIDEDGGEAAAFTEVQVTGSCAYDPNAKSYDMILDRPFIFAITDTDNTPLFIGVINNPEK